MFRNINHTHLSVLFALSFLLLGGAALAGQTAMEKAVAETNPDAYGSINGPIELIGDERGLGWLEVVSAVETKNSSRAPGDTVYAGETVRAGILLNSSANQLTLRAGDGSELLLEENELVEVRVAATTACSVTCQSGYYACCKPSGWFEEKCWCVANGTSKPSNCDHGGPGSSGCSTGD